MRNEVDGMPAASRAIGIDPDEHAGPAAAQHQRAVVEDDQARLHRADLGHQDRIVPGLSFVGTPRLTVFQIAVIPEDAHHPAVFQAADRGLAWAATFEPTTNVGYDGPDDPMQAVF